MTRRIRRHAIQPVPKPNALTRERAQHDRVTLAIAQIVDALGGIGLPHYVETPLQRLYRQHEISDREMDAGNEFRRLYRMAVLDPLRAATLDERIAGGPRLPHGSEAAYRRCTAILRALGSRDGSLEASCAEAVIGSEMSIAEWARDQRWGRRNIGEHAAKRVLLATLEKLPALLEKRA